MICRISYLEYIIMMNRIVVYELTIAISLYLNFHSESKQKLQTDDEQKSFRVGGKVCTKQTC